MPRKAGLIKTYGRHRFRTVKTAPWVSPDDVFRSPVSKKEKSFETPTNIRYFPSHQCFLVFEFANGGQDLEHFEFNSYSEAISVLQQITLSLAVAESSLEFEHRDLHWGNVLIIRNDEEEINYHLNGQAMQIDSYGVHVSVIDFTLSRLKKGKYCCENIRLINIELNHVVDDELYLVLPISDVLTNNIINEAIHWDRKDDWDKKAGEGKGIHLKNLLFAMHFHEV